MPFNRADFPATVPTLMSYQAVEGIGFRMPKTQVYPVEVLRNTVNNSATATVVATNERIIDVWWDMGLQAGVTYHYWFRYARTLSTGKVLRSPTLRYQTNVPLAPVPAENSVVTAQLAAKAVTDRSTYEETGSEYVSYGMDSGGGVTNPGDEVWTLPDINFLGDGNTMVITAICRQSETPVYFRVGNSSVWASVEAAIVNKTTGITIDAEELTVAGIRVEQQGVGPNAWLTFAHHRDFNHNFVIPTVAGNTYCVRFKLTCGADDPSNYILWATTLRQVLWQVFKR